MELGTASEQPCSFHVVILPSTDKRMLLLGDFTSCPHHLGATSSISTQSALRNEHFTAAQAPAPEHFSAHSQRHQLHSRPLVGTKVLGDLCLLLPLFLSREKG